MKYVVKYETKNGFTNRIVSAGNPWQACVTVVKELPIDKPAPGGFLVNTLHPLGATEYISFGEVFKLMLLANNSDIPPESLMDTQV